MDTDDSRERALRQEIEHLRTELARAEREATFDALTGCLNRRGWTRCLGAEERRCRRHDLDAVVVVVDLDGLKTVNDEYGHAAGDRRLVECADALRAAVRAEDAVARIGGDEFAVLAVQTTPATAAPRAVVTQIERRFEATEVKASLGWARRSEHGGLADAVMAADRGMLALKGQRAGTR
jgi:diguanylate cyclase (GGDEF)-like protein